jgi:hypothetical protein
VVQPIGLNTFLHTFETDNLPTNLPAPIDSIAGAQEVKKKVGIGIEAKNMIEILTSHEDLVFMQEALWTIGQLQRTLLIKKEEMIDVMKSVMIDVTIEEEMDEMREVCAIFFVLIITAIRNYYSPSYKNPTFFGVYCCAAKRE